MAIQLRRGAYENYDASKLKPAEVGVVQSGDPNTTDGKAIYIAINTNDVKRIPTADEMVDHNAEAEGIYDNIVAQNRTASQLFQNTSIKAAEAEQSASTASSASASANSSMQRAETAANLLTNVTATAQTLETGQQATASYSNGVFSFGLPKGNTGNTGAKGDKGDTGATPNLSVGAVTTLEPGSDATVEITGTAEAPVLKMGIPRGNTGEVSAEEFYKAFTTDTATGSIAHFTDGADNIPMKDVLVHIEPVQAGSGDPSPDNVRPITGWTGAQVTRTGKNLWTFDDSYSASGYTVLLNRVPFSLYPGTYTFSAVPNIEADSVVLFGYHEDGTRTEIGRLNASTTRSSSTATVSKPVVSLYLVVNRSGTISNIQLELGSTATDYEPYSGQTYDITFPSEAGTVYGGTLNVTKGELVVDMAMADLGTLNWSERTEGSNDWIARTPNNSIDPVIAGDISAITSVYVNSKKIGLPEDGQFILNSKSISSSLRIICIKDSRYADAGTFKTAVTGQQLVYKLATPITYQLTPQEITSLLGTNNLWADTGDSEVEYRADTKLYITKIITEAVSALS